MPAYKWTRKFRAIIAIKILHSDQAGWNKRSMSQRRRRKGKITPTLAQRLFCSLFFSLSSLPLPHSLHLWEYREGQHYHKITCPPTPTPFLLTSNPITLSQPINQDAGVMAAGGVVAVVTWRILVWVWNHLTLSINLSRVNGRCSSQQAGNKSGLVLIKLCCAHLILNTGLDACVP